MVEQSDREVCLLLYFCSSSSSGYSFISKFMFGPEGEVDEDWDFWFSTGN